MAQAIRPCIGLTRPDAIANARYKQRESGPLKLSLSQRYAAWKAMYDKLKNEAEVASSLPNYSAIGKSRPPYFYEGMHDNHGLIGGKRHVPPPR